MFLAITTIITVAAFLFMFAKVMSSRFNNYIINLILAFVGAVLALAHFSTQTEPNTITYVAIYCCAIIIPVFMLILEKKGIYINYYIRELFVAEDKKKEFFLSILDKDFTNYWAHKKLAECYKKTDEKEKYENELMSMLELKPKNYDLYCDLAQVQIELNKRERAMQTLNSVLTEKPDHLKANMKLTEMLYDDGKFKEAIMVLNNVQKYHPEEYDVYYLLGMTYTRLNDFKKAKENYLKAAQINGLEGITKLNLGELSLIFKDYESAEKYFFECLNDKDDKIVSNSYYYLAKVKMIQKNYPQAIQYANLAIEVYPKMKRRIELDDIFIPVLAKLNIRMKDSRAKEIESTMNEREEEMVDFLGRTYDVVEKLTVDYTQADEDERENQYNNLDFEREKNQ